MIKKLLGALVLMFAVSGPAMSAAAGYPWDRAPERITDLAALQNGAKLFVNYCLNCQSANAMRYNKLVDLGLTEKEIEEYLLFTGDKVGDKMTVAMNPKDAKLWLGVAPPDLSVMARAKAANLGQPGTDYIYTYLRTFYRDVTRPLGWNNLVFPNAGMPNVFWQESGPSELTTVTVHPVERTGRCNGSRQPRWLTQMVSPLLSVMSPWLITKVRLLLNKRSSIWILPSRPSLITTWLTWLPSLAGWPNLTNSSASNWEPGFCCSWHCSL